MNDCETKQARCDVGSTEDLNPSILTVPLAVTLTTSPASNAKESSVTPYFYLTLSLKFLP